MVIAGDVTCNMAHGFLTCMYMRACARARARVCVLNRVQTYIIMSYHNRLFLYHDIRHPVNT